MNEKFNQKAERLQEEFLENCKKYRKNKQLTQTDLAKRIGVIQQNISHLECGGRNVTLSNLIKYLLGLGIDINDLFK